MGNFITDSNYGDNQVRLPIDFDPSKYDTKEAAAKAFYQALRPVVEAYGHDPDIECGIFSPEEASQRGYGAVWVVWWEAGPYQWGIPTSMWLYNYEADWFTEPYYSFDVTFTS